MTKSKNWFDFHSGSLKRLSRGACLDSGQAGFADHPAHRRAPEVEIGLAELHLQFGGALVVGQPVIGDDAEGLDQLRQLVRRLVDGLAALARLQIGGQGLAAILHRLGHVERKSFGIERFGGRVARDFVVSSFGVGGNFGHGATTASFQSGNGTSPRKIDDGTVRGLPQDSDVLHRVMYSALGLASVILKIQAFSVFSRH